MRACRSPPLAGMRVLDVTTSIAGPYCAEILGALGADVIKVERPDTGDDGRAWGPPFWDGEGTMFLSANASKRSLAVLACAIRAGARRCCGSLDGADVFLQSLRPGLAERLGLGAEELRARNPRLVYCSVGAYGSVGPQREEPGYDALMQAAGGLISMTGEPGRPGVRVGSSLIDQGTGTWAALGILAALLERASTGDGPRRRRLALRDRARLHRLPPRRLPRRRHGAARRGHALPDGRALPGDPDPRRRADGRRRERPPLRAPLPRARRRRAGGRPALPHEPRPGREPRRADRAARAVLRPGRHRLLARAAHARRRAGRAGRGRGGRPRLTADRGARDRAEPPPPGDPGPPPAGAAALARRRPRRAPQPAAAPRRAHRRDPRARPATPTTRSPSSPQPASSASPKPSNRLFERFEPAANSVGRRPAR